MPWATTPESNAIATPEQYSAALLSAGFEVSMERNRRDFALTYFEQLQSKIADRMGQGRSVYIRSWVRGEEAKAQVANMIESIPIGRITPHEFIAY